MTSTNLFLIYSSALLFADDIALCKEIVTPSDQDLLQADLSDVFEWSHKWQLNLNPSKCESICISYTHSPPPASYKIIILYQPNLLSDTWVHISIPIFNGQTTSSMLLQRQLDP